MAERQSFAVRFRCRNCGTMWRETFFKGDRVTKEFDGVVVRDHRCTHGADCPYCRIVECPTCGAKEEVEICARYPLG